MKLLAKFNLIFILFFGAGLAVAAWSSRRFLQENARDEVIHRAQLMMESATAVRTYTSQEIKPLLVKTQQHQITFLPQTVPAYGATTTFNFLRKDEPEYSYKEATLNPTNLRDRAADWEADVINGFRDNPAKKEFIGERDTPSGRALYLSRPIHAPTPCLECHSTPDRAPKAMIAAYGSNNGFGWKDNEIIGAQIVSVPMSVPFQIAGRAFSTLLIYLTAVFLATMLCIDAALVFIVIRPVRRLASMADRISTGDTNLPELPVQGRDEVSALTVSFNRMYVSLSKALKMLEE
jgi:protein-histidine pros-kinase